MKITELAVQTQYLEMDSDYAKTTLTRLSKDTVLCVNTIWGENESKMSTLTMEEAQDLIDENEYLDFVEFNVYTL